MLHDTIFMYNNNTYNYSFVLISNFPVEFDLPLLQKCMNVYLFDQKFLRWSVALRTHGL